MNLIATKPFRYGIRALKYGDSFHAPDNIGRILVLLGDAKREENGMLIEGMVRKGGQNREFQIKDRPAPPAPMTAAEGNGIDALRKEYERLTGEMPDGRWGKRRLAEEIARTAKS